MWDYRQSPTVMWGDTQTETFKTALSTLGSRLSKGDEYVEIHFVEAPAGAMQFVPNEVVKALKRFNELTRYDVDKIQFRLSFPKSTQKGSKVKVFEEEFPKDWDFYLLGILPPPPDSYWAATIKKFGVHTPQK